MNSQEVFNIGTYIGCAVLTATQVNEIMSIIQICLTCALILFNLICNVVSKLKEAKKDGKITKEERDDIKADVNSSVNEIISTINNHKKGDKDD